MKKKEKTKNRIKKAVLYVILNLKWELRIFFSIRIYI